MKKIVYLLTVSLVFFSLHAGAQCQMSLNEMEKLTKLDDTKYAREVTKQGFKLQSSRSSEIYKVYVCSDKNRDGKYDEIKRSIDPNAKIMLQLSTTDKAYFEKFQNLIAKNYKFIMDHPMQVNGVNTTQHLYTGKCNVSLYSYTMPDKVTWHTLQISEK